MSRALVLVAGSIAGGALAAALARSMASSPPGGTLADSAQAIYEDAVSALAGWQLPERAAPYAQAIAEAELANELPAGILGRLLYQESRFRADIISGETASPAGALGIAQFMPSTAAQLRIDPLDPYQAIAGAGAYLAYLYRQTGNWRDALGAYNWGLGNVQRRGLLQAPRETREYVAAIASDVGLA